MSAQQSFNSFLDEMAKELSIHRNEILTRLKELGYNSYSPSKKMELRAAILADEYLQEASKRAKVKARVMLTLEPPPAPCPIPECNGKKMRTVKRFPLYANWACSIHGDKHYIAWWTTELRDKVEHLTDEEYQKSLKDIANHLENLEVKSEEEHQ